MTTHEDIITNAWDWLSHSFQNVDDDVLLTSPYLTAEVCDFIAAAAKHSPYNWTVVTTLDEKAVADGTLSVTGLRTLLNASVTVKDVRRLHAKCFIVGSRAMLGSANLTGRGTGKAIHANAELGVGLSLAHATQARSWISSLPHQRVDAATLDDLALRARHLTGVPDDPQEAPTRETALRLAEQLLIDARDGSRELWLKLEYGDPALEGWRKDSWFASPDNGRPACRPGDLVVICAKGTYDCYAILEVTSVAEYQPVDYAEWINLRAPEDLTRYPWINRTAPRLVPSHLVNLNISEIGALKRGLQNGHIRLSFDQFTAAASMWARIAFN